MSELVSALKFKSTLPQENYITIVHFLLQDSGEYIDNSIVDKNSHLYNTGAAEAAKPYLSDLIEFVADSHVLNRMKSLSTRGNCLREDTLGGDLKASISRFIAVEISKAMRSDPKVVTSYLPWLMNPPSTTQQGYVLAIIS